MISTHAIVNHRLTTAWLNRVERAGIAAVEIFCAPQHLDYRNKSQVAELGHWFRDSELKLHSLHSPMYTDEIWGRSGPDTHINITDRKKADRIQWVDEIKRALEVAEIIPFTLPHPAPRRRRPGILRACHRRRPSPRSRNSTSSPTSAASRSCSKTFPTNSATAERLQLSSTT